MDIIIFCGQSNMQGLSECLSGTECISNAYEYRFLTDEIVPLKNPVGEDIGLDRREGYPSTPNGDPIKWIDDHITGRSYYGNTNLVPEFCKEYINVTGNKVLAVHIAKGSTPISYWLSSEVGYRMILEKTNAAIEKVQKKNNIEKIYFVWLQGESDQLAGNSKDYYKKCIIKLCELLKKDIGIDKFGIIRVGRWTNDERDIEIISAQDEVCIENDDFLMLTDIAVTLNEIPEYMNQFEYGHYSVKGLEKLGYEAGKTLGTFAVGNSK